MEDKPEEHVEASEKPGQKRKAPATDPEDKTPEAQQSDAPPPKKKKKKNAGAQDPPAEAAASTDKPQEPAAPAAQSAAEKDKASDEPTKETKKRKKNKKSAAAVEEVTEPTTATTEPEKEQGQETEKTKAKGKKKDKAKEVEKEKSKEDAQNAKEKAKEKGRQAAKDKQKAAEPAEESENELEVLIQKYEKEIAAEKRSNAEEKTVNGVALSTPKQVATPDDSGMASLRDVDQSSLIFDYRLFLIIRFRLRSILSIPVVLVGRLTIRVDDETPTPLPKATASVKVTANEPVVNGEWDWTMYPTSF